MDYYQIMDTAEQLLTLGWTANHEAIDALGRNVAPWDESAVKWCVLGSIKAASYHLDEGGSLYEKAVKYCMTVITSANLAIVKGPYNKGTYVENENDATSQQRAIEMVRRGKELYLKHPVKV